MDDAKEYFIVPAEPHVVADSKEQACSCSWIVAGRSLESCQEFAGNLRFSCFLLYFLGFLGQKIVFLLFFDFFLYFLDFFIIFRFFI